MTPSQEVLSEVTIFNKYAKYIPELKRRETWRELCDRNMNMHISKFPFLEKEIREVYEQYVILKLVLPSMRSLQFGGRPIELSNARIFNCSYLPVDTVEAFSETMFLLLSGTGVGYGVQDSQVEKLPPVVGPTRDKTRRFLIGDSIEGWADAIKVLMKAYFRGKPTPIFDYRDIRPKGARLVTSGGKAPGPEPLRVCINRIQEMLETCVGRSMTPLEAHDIQCHIADAVLSGGIRRAAMIALFSADNEEMLTCKGQLPIDNWELSEQENASSRSYHGYCIYKGKRKDVVLSEWDYDNLIETKSLPWYFFEQQRGRANNSAVLRRGAVTEAQFKALWKKVEDSHSGEPGIFWTNDEDWGTNPCCEIALRPYQVCNLTETNVSNVASQEDLNSRVRAASFLGTLQASYTDFHYLRSIWQETTEKDALIGVGMTGIGSGAVLQYSLTEAAEVVLKENARVAKLIGINPSARNTTVKPSGSTSLVVGSSSGIHAWHNDYYIRRMRVGKNEALYRYMKDNFPALIEDCFFKPSIDAVMSFPQKAPEGAIYRTESFKDLLERVKRFNLEWVRPGHRDGTNSHNVSCTISLKDSEWEECGAWMWENRDHYTGISVLPFDGGTYVQAPFENCTKEVFDDLSKHLHAIDLSNVREEEDITDHKLEPACAGGVCEVSMA